MADSYLSISEIANDEWMVERMRAAVTQQVHLGSVPLIGDTPEEDPLTWVARNRYIWASSPGWGAAWDSALAAHPPGSEPDYEPGRDPAVITDGQILSTVQALGGPGGGAVAEEREVEEPARKRKAKT